MLVCEVKNSTLKNRLDYRNSQKSFLPAPVIYRKIKILILIVIRSIKEDNDETV